MYTTGSTDTFGRLFEYDIGTSIEGGLLGSDDDSGAGTNFRIEESHDDNATIHVSGFLGTATGDYTVFVDCL